MPNGNQQVAIERIYRGYKVRKTTIDALRRKGFVALCVGGRPVLTEAGIAWLDEREVPA
jgi:hypothetical protein